MMQEIEYEWNLHHENDKNKALQEKLIEAIALIDYIEQNLESPKKIAFAIDEYRLLAREEKLSGEGK